DYGEYLLGCLDKLPHGRTNWVKGDLDYSNTPGNYDPAVYIVPSPIFPYVGKNTQIFKCPADQARIATAGGIKPRVRSNSMSQVFAFGSWLTPDKFRIYEKTVDIVFPSRTFVFVDEHRNSINDAAFA